MTQQLETNQGKQLELAQQVSDLLASHLATMLQLTASEICSYLESGLATLWTSQSDPEQVVAFGKLYSWPGTNQIGQKVYELSSWVVQDAQQGLGWGKKILYELVKKGKDTDPHCQIIGVVALDNHHAQQVLIQAGGHVLNRDEWPSNLQILLHDGQAQVVVIDVSSISYQEAHKAK